MEKKEKKITNGVQQMQLRRMFLAHVYDLLQICIPEKRYISMEYVVQCETDICRER